MAGWLAVGAYEVYAIVCKKETMSQAFWALRRKLGVPVLACAWIVLTKHLFGKRDFC